MTFRQLLKRTPFLLFAFFLGSGIWLAHFVKNQYLTAVSLAVAVMLLLFLSVVFNARFSSRFHNRWLSGGCFYLLLVLTGILLVVAQRPALMNGSFQVEGKARVVEADVTYSGYHSYTIEPLSLKAEGRIPPCRNRKWKIIAEPPDSLLMPLAKPGYLVQFRTIISGHSKPPNPDAFDYGRYLFQQGISASGFVAKEDFQVLKEQGLSGIRGYVNTMRQETITIYRKYGIEGRELQVLSALTLGVRSMLNDEVKNWFIHSGAVHVLAVSGLHTGIIFLLLNWLLDLFLPKRSGIRVVVVVSVLAFYALLTGGAPSVFRAVVMLSVIQVGKYYQKSSNIYNLLGVSSFVILTVHPMSLYHLGFWLSHLAVAGIVTFYPVFRRVYSGGNIFVRGIGDLTAVSVSAQIGTLPLSLFTFRAFPTWFLLSNFLVLPMIAPSLVFAKLLVLFSEVPFISFMLAGVLNGLLGFLLGVVEWLNFLPHSYVKGLWVNGVTVGLLYAAIITFMIWVHTKFHFYLKSTLFFLLGLMIVFNLDYYRKKHTNALVVFDAKRQNIFGIVESGNGLILSDSIVTDRQLDFTGSGFFAKNSFNVRQKALADCWSEKGEAMICKVRERKYLVVGNVDVEKLEPESIPLLAGIIFSGDVKGDVAAFLNKVKCERLIVARSCPPWCTKKWVDKVDSLGLEMHFVAETGAYVSR
jgi:competence protein ComEC